MLGPDRLHTLVIFAVAAIAALAWAVWSVGRATTRRRVAYSVLAIVTAIVCGVSTMGLQINRHLGYVETWGDVLDLLDPSIDSGPVHPVLHKPPKREARDPVLPGHEDDPAWKTSFNRDSNGALKTDFRGPISKVHESVWVWVPPGDSPNNGKVYKVVLILHGYPGNPKRVPLQLDLAAISKAHPDTIFAIPSLKIRRAYGDCVDIKGAPRIGTWVTQDVVGMVRHNFPNTASTREGWTIAGASFGGYCAPVLGLTNPHLFSRIIAFSGYDAPETGHLLAANRVVRRKFTVSRLMAEQREWPQKYYATGTANDRKSSHFIKSLRSVGSKNVMLTTFLGSEGGHNWSVWRGQLPAALKWNEKP